MSKWISRISEHRIWAEIRSVGQLIDESMTTRELTDEEIVDLERIRTVLGYVGNRLTATDRLVITPSSLDEIAAAFSDMQAPLKDFSTDSDLARLKEAIRFADAAAQNATHILSPGTPDELTEVGEPAAMYRTPLERFRASLSETQGAEAKELENLQAGLVEVSAILQAGKDRLSQLVTEQQDQFSKAQETRTTDFSSALQAALSQVTQLSTEYQNQFSAAQDARARDFTEAQAGRQAKFQELLDNYSQSLRDAAAESSKHHESHLSAQQDDLANLTKDYRAKAEEIWQRVHERESDVVRLTGVVENLGATAGYLKSANSARRSLWLWQFIAVASIGGLIWTAIDVFYPALKGQENFSWPGFAGLVFTLLTIGALAVYAAKKADNFFDAERRSRKLALKLAAIGPYLDFLPIELKNDSAG